MQIRQNVCSLALFSLMMVWLLHMPHKEQASPEDSTRQPQPDASGKPEGVRLLRASVSGETTDYGRRLPEGKMHARTNHRAVICPFLGTGIHEGALPVKDLYTKAELLQFTIDAGLEESKAILHINSNFKHIPEGIIDVFNMEGRQNEHTKSTGAHDCKTAFAECSPVKPMSNLVNPILQCYNDTQNKSCGVPSLSHHREFVRAVDLDLDGIMTIGELVSAATEDRIPFVDANPIGSGTIEGAFSDFFDVFGNADQGMWTETLEFVSLQRRFPHGYVFPHLPRLVDVLDPTVTDRGQRIIASMFVDRSGKGHDIVPQALKYDGNSVDLTNKLLQIKHKDTLDTGIHSFTLAAWIKPTSVQSPASIFVIKKGHGMYFSAGRAGWTPGWELGHGFVDDGVRFTGRDAQSTTSGGERCSGVMKLNRNLTWSSTLGQWLHVAVVFSRKELEARLYLNAELQRTSVSLKNCTGSWANSNNLEIGSAYGWKANHDMKSFQMVRETASQAQIRAIAENGIRRRRNS